MATQTNEQLLDHIITEENRLVRMEEEIKSLRVEITELKQAVEDIVTAWKAATFFLGVIKWVAGIGAGLLAILAFIKGVK